MRRLLSLSLLCAACGGQDIYVNLPRGGEGRFTTPSKINAYLEGKTLLMAGASIPSHPNGYDEDMNFGQATQCYRQVQMQPQAGRYHVMSQLGTLNDAPTTGTKGECDHSTMSSELVFDSTAALVENVQGDGECFDFTITYPGFGQEGRGTLQDGGATLVLELFFKDQATGHRCAAGAVGSGSITLNQMPFTGDARQTYQVSE